jgi:hypothetical protein
MTMPNFFVIGAAKAGTTAMHATLSLHPQIFMSQVKETNYFIFPEAAACYRIGDDNELWRKRSIADRASYEALFAGSAAYPVRGESSPGYGIAPFEVKAAERIAAEALDAKFLYIIRQPAEWMYSSYTFSCQLQAEPEPNFRAARATGSARIAANHFPRPYYLPHPGFLETIQLYQQLMGREQVKVILYDEFRWRPIPVLQEIALFLGVDPAAMPTESVKANQTYVPGMADKLARRFGALPWVKSLLPRAPRLRQWLRTFRFQTRGAVPPMDPALHHELTEQFRPDIEALAAFLGRDLSHWLIDKRDAAQTIARS